MTQALPVTEALPELREALREGVSAVLVAPPGAGKTTLVPLALLKEDWLEGRKILLLEPRRLAARAAALRMAELLGESDVGGTVGYRMRLETRVGPNTRIEVVTEGVLTRMLQSDPTLTGVGLVIFDEFHERSLQADAGLAFSLHARALFRPALRVLVMSATLDAAPVATLFGGAPVIRAEGRMHPVETRWLDRPIERWVEPGIARTVLELLGTDAGDVLVFLPGAAEIRRTGALLSGAVPQDTDVHELFGMLPRAAQDQALRPAPAGRRKVVLASAIAESSLTIEGVRVVVDAGLMRIPRFDPGSGMTRLVTVRVTRDAADQRRGRAGRTAPGVCVRMWTRQEELGLVPTRAPEIRDADLSPLAMELAGFGAKADELPWLDAPPAAALAHAGELLDSLGAVDRKGGLTAHGARMATLGVHPRMAHMILEGMARGWGGLACDLAALLEERDVLRGDGAPPEVDLRLRVEALQRGRRSFGRGLTVAKGAVGRARKQAASLRRRAASLGARRSHRAAEDGAGHAMDSAGDVGILAALAYPDRVGRIRGGSRGRYLLRNGRGANVAESDPLAGESWIVAVELEGRGRDGRVHQATPVSQEAIEDAFGHDIEEVEEIGWDDRAGRVRARKVRRLGALVLAEGSLNRPDPEAVAAAMAAGVAARGLHVLPWDRETTQLRQRMAFLRALEPDGWPEMSEEALLADVEQWLVPFLGGVRSLDDLAGVRLGDALLARIPWPRRADLERLAPTHVEVPSGSRIFLDYADPEGPVLAVRLQELFGLLETPRVGGGRIPLTLHLLSPAQRPMQVTRDLASFWKGAYFEVRKDLRARYPKHHWPEDPLTAEPTRRTKRRRNDDR